MRSKLRSWVCPAGVGPLLLMSGAALAGACSDFDLNPVREAPEPEVTEPDPPPRTAWDDVDGTERPEILVAAAWRDVASPEDIRQQGWRCYGDALQPPRFGFLDLEGRLLLEVRPPDESFVVPPLDPHDPRRPDRSRLVPAGATRFLAVSTTRDAPQRARRAWIADGERETSAHVLGWTASPWTEDAVDAELTLLATGAVLSLPHPVLDVLVDVDPVDPDVVWLAPLHRTRSMDADTPLLWRVPLDEPERAYAWTVGEIFGDTAVEVEVAGWFPSSVDVVRRGGSVLVMVGMVGAGVVGERLVPEGPGIMVAFEPTDERVHWDFDFSFRPTGPSSAAVGAEGGPAWLSPSFPADGGLSASLDRFDQLAAAVDVAPEPDSALHCPQTAALLDADAPTALFQAVVEDDEGLVGSALFVSHRGERVWRVDGVREGLRRSAVLFDDVVVLPAVE